MESRRIRPRECEVYGEFFTIPTDSESPHVQTDIVLHPALWDGLANRQRSSLESNFRLSKTGVTASFPSITYIINALKQYALSLFLIFFYMCFVFHIYYLVSHSCPQKLLRKKKYHETRVFYINKTNFPVTITLAAVLL